MRRKQPARVLGPYEETGQWRLIIVEDGSRRSVFLPSREEALKFKKRTEREFAKPKSRRIADVLDEWTKARLREGQAKPDSIWHSHGRLTTFFADALEEDIAAVTPRRAEALYQASTERCSEKTGRVWSASTHRYTLCLAQGFYRWASRRGYVGSSPFRDVRPIGKVNVGKPQLRIEEARRFTSAALTDFEEKRDPLAIGALVALMMGLRTSEVLDRVARDLDDGARYLWIDGGKTVNARRHLEVPELLRPYLLLLAEQKQPDGYLFSVGETRRRRQKLWEMVRHLCERAGVPIVCTHSLRGLYATLAVQSGAASHVVAANLGHHSFEMTQRHYAQSSAVSNAATARVLGRLGPERSTNRLSAEALMQQLDEETLARLLELVAEAKKGGAPKNQR